MDAFNKVLFQTEQFDIGNIYNAGTSTFVPLKAGVYLVAGTVTLLPDSTTTEYRVRVEIHVNGVSVAADNDYWGEIDQAGVLFVNAINGLHHPPASTRQPCRSIYYEYHSRSHINQHSILLYTV
ncbi:hypothetical protein JOC95_000333 [Bacillus tianshenii]|uniref:C1q domain-containing protein n=1 Tax=Sutcliffiella tianshenii TaxID=1463404 RepID=A0ABS2NV04_9BACI|nr:hypothetical protein [Bacillus tianshenii]MBM7618491.1 hypothetical protein [Bacillus tianshenii]